MRALLPAFLLACAVLSAQESPGPTAHVTQNLILQARRITATATAEVATRDAWEPLRARRLAEMRDSLSLLPWPPKTPLNPRVTRTIDRGDYTIELVAFESLPQVYVTANLYLPKTRAARVPGIIYVCGHAFSDSGNKTSYQRHGISFARNGYAAIILDSVQTAEAFGTHHGVGRQRFLDWFSRAYSPAAIEVWNAIRAIDYLESRPEIDPTRIGMTGRSGGAAMTWFTAAVDERIKVAAPIMGISTYAANVEADTQRGHCDCMFPINFPRHDMLHQGALIAPRPLLMAHGIKDTLFPVPGYREFERVISGLYASYGYPERFRNIEVDTGHADSDFLREQAIAFFDRHLLGIPERRLVMEYENLPEADLAVFSGSPPQDSRNHLVHEILIPDPKFDPPLTLAEWEQRRAALLKTLRQQVFPTLVQPASTPVVRRLPPVDKQPWRELEIEADEGLTVRAFLRKPSKIEKPLPALLYIASEGEELRDIDGILSAAHRRNASVRMVLYPRATSLTPLRRTDSIGLLRNAMHIGETLDSLRLHDVLRAVAALRAEPGVDPARILVAGEGIAAGLALYAAILDESIEQVALISPPASHRDGPIFLGILRHLDLPEAAALVAPRRVSFYNHIPEPYEAARAVYSLYGQPTRLFLTMHFEGLLEGLFHHGFASGN